ncbi:ribonucleoside-diphosphate reductase alpha chain [Streptomyces sp. BK022]|uniref:ribonucleoside-triphosphate reductase n=1 Tax=Streptomyces sp. BK022 TaxID=2512123 RepID=UPI0010295217|nr:ribonucleoside-triphosphate reductase [Streptomyces sp. BK022]RZU35967.1 ribonucleoside-diphosphate reductase alpha chain [Streptomyces sp. BK022]
MTTLLTTAGDLADPYRSFIAKSRYSRWLDDENRRETWTETVARYVTFMLAQLKDKHDYTPDPQVVDEIHAAILNHEVMPSMRAVMTAGPALDRSNIAGFNCSYLPLKDARALDELLYILMNGTGVGYSVERKYTDQLPPVPDALRQTKDKIVVHDSKEGWGIGFRLLLEDLWQGKVPTWDLSKVRPAGARLNTFGGRASGPEPLNELFEFVVQKFHQAAGRKFRPIEVHDIACKIASVVVVGGVRRSAMISLSDLDDKEMAEAKSGEWWVEHPYRALANNSAVYTDGMRHEDFRTEWDSLVASGSGERGIFHRGAAQRQAARFGKRESDTDYGTNPCSEIILRPFSFCNLSEVVVRAEDTPETLTRKVRLAAVLGTWQSTLTDYPYLRDEWRKNAEEERLLGVSLTGVYGNPYTNGSKGMGLTSLALTVLRSEVVEANAAEARRIGIAASVATTCVKPSGTVSQLVDCESGLHQKHAKFYFRRVRVDKKDPIAFVLIDAGLPYEEDAYNSAAWVFTFAQRAAEGALVREDVSAIEHLELWLAYQRAWCEHKPSVTISVREHEWEQVGEWVWEHLDEISGVSFLPYSDHTYVQAPYEECTEAEYEALAAKNHRVEWSDLAFYETFDQTKGSQELACSAAGGCEVVDLVTT